MPLISSENSNPNHHRSSATGSRTRLSPTPRQFPLVSRTARTPGRHVAGHLSGATVRPSASLLPSTLPSRPRRRVIAGFVTAASVVIVGTIAAAANASEPAAVHVAAANDRSVLPPATFVAQVDQLRVTAEAQAQDAMATAAAAAPAPTAAPERRPAGPSFTGLASWYGDEGFDNRTTASGATFRADGFTAASRTLPFGTRLHVCRASTCVDVVVTDRGPYVDGRVLDLSRGAARVLGMLSAGVAEVTATPVG